MNPPQTPISFDLHSALIDNVQETTYRSMVDLAFCQIKRQQENKSIPIQYIHFHIKMDEE